MDTVKFTVDISVKKKDIQDLLVCAFEGGSNYWYDQLDTILETSEAKHASDRFYENMVENGFTLIDKETGHKHAVLPNQFEKGLKLMHDKFPSHFNDIKTENTDAATGDVFLQLLVHGDVIYG